MNLFKRAVAATAPSGGKLWSSEKEFDERWKRRISTMAGFIDAPGPVADLGCGMMWLEQFLRVGNAYVPVDYVRRDDRTRVIDFNTEKLPDLGAKVAFLSGSLEYVREAVEFLKILTGMEFEQIILSYCTTEKFHDMKIRRRALKWTSHLSIYQILTAFTGQYDLTGFVEMESNDTIFAFRRKHEGLHS